MDSTSRYGSTKALSYLVYVAPAALARRTIDVAIPTVMPLFELSKPQPAYTNHSLTTERQDHSDAPLMFKAASQVQPSTSTCCRTRYYLPLVIHVFITNPSWFFSFSLQPKHPTRNLHQALSACWLPNHASKTQRTDSAPNP